MATEILLSTKSNPQTDEKCLLPARAPTTSILNCKGTPFQNQKCDKMKASKLRNKCPEASGNNFDHEGSNARTYTSLMSFLILAGRGNVPAHGKNLASLGDLIGLGRNPQKGVALSKVTPFTSCGLHAAKHRATYPPSEFPTT